MKTFLLTITAIMASAAAMPANAATIIQTYSVGTTPPSLATVTFNQFDPALGRLSSITLDIISRYTASGSVRNTGTARSFTATAGANTTTVAPRFGVKFIDLGTSSANLGRIARNGTANFGPLTGQASLTDTITSGFAPYLGTGTVTFGYTALGGVVVTPLLGRAVSSNTEIGSDFTLTYNFTAVPEPATWAMLILGFALVGGAVRRRPADAARLA